MLLLLALLGLYEDVKHKGAVGEREKVRKDTDDAVARQQKSDMRIDADTRDPREQLRAQNAQRRKRVLSSK